MTFSLYDYQEEAVSKLKKGSVLAGRVGSGKSLTSLTYYIRNHRDKPLYIITVAKKRNDKEWDRDFELLGISGVVDSWNNIKKYSKVTNAFFIFDEQRAVGYGTWGKEFVKIAKGNEWIMLSATPGDVWMDYLPLFLANRLYKNKTEFISKHVVYRPYTNFPQISHYINTGILERYRKNIIVPMRDTRTTKIERSYVNLTFDKQKYDTVIDNRKNPYNDGEPIVNPSELTQVLRRIVNTDPRKIEVAKKHIDTIPRAIVFYNYSYELDILIAICEELGKPYSQWNGKRHESIIDGDKWVYLVQYTAGCEGWNCVLTDTILFYSLNYSYRVTEQSEGRINRINTPYEVLNYIYLKTPKSVDDKIHDSIRKKGKFNEKAFVKDLVRESRTKDSYNNDHYDPSLYSKLKSSRKGKVRPKSKRLERDFQRSVILEIKERLPEAIIKKNDAGHIQGIPDLTIEYGPVSCHLEVKAFEDANVQPNQATYIDKYKALGGFAAFIYPHNRKEILDEMERALSTSRKTLVS